MFTYLYYLLLFLSHVRLSHHNPIINYNYGQWEIQTHRYMVVTKEVIIANNNMLLAFNIDVTFSVIFVEIWLDWWTGHEYCYAGNLYTFLCCSLPVLCIILRAMNSDRLKVLHSIGVINHRVYKEWLTYFFARVFGLGLIYVPIWRDIHDCYSVGDFPASILSGTSLFVYLFYIIIVRCPVLQANGTRKSRFLFTTISGKMLLEIGVWIAEDPVRLVLYISSQ